MIGFDPRGVGRSTAVTCFDAAGMDDYLYSIPAAPRGSAEWETELLASHKKFAEACEANSNGILPFVTTINAARDMDLIRGVLGDKKLNYLGYSYGTFLGATYAELYPERAGRLVLDGAIDPAVSGLEVSATQAIGFESALRAYMKSCLDSGKCPFNGSVDEAMTDLGALLASVDASPLKNGDGRRMGADALMTGIIAALYSEDSWSYLTEALNGALQGDPSIAFQLADFYNGRENGAYADNSSEAFRAYNCMDYPVEDDPAAEAASTAKIAEGAPTIAKYWDGPDSCSVWPYPPTGTRGEIHAKGAGADPRRRHHQRPGDAVRVVGVARQAARRGRADHPRRGGAHRLQQGQHVRRQGRRGLLPGRHGARERPALRVMPARFASTLRNR